MKRIFVGIALIVLSVSYCLSQTKSQATGAEAASSDLLAEAKRAIDKGNAQWIEAWAKGDSTMVSAIFADDGVLLSGSGKVIKGRQQILERQKAAMETLDPGVKVTVTTVNVWLDGDTAYETGKYKYEYREKGKPGTDEGRYVTMWKRQTDGSWKLLMDVGVPKD
ncbi:MAG: SgcJ/EcaC family oxidoreductase [bacterium]